jgi:hypothetical protein
MCISIARPTAMTVLCGAILGLAACSGTGSLPQSPDAVTQDKGKNAPPKM